MYSEYALYLECHEIVYPALWEDLRRVWERCWPAEAVPFSGASPPSCNQSINQSIKNEVVGQQKLFFSSEATSSPPFYNQAINQPINQCWPAEAVLSSEAFSYPPSCQQAINQPINQCWPAEAVISSDATSYPPSCNQLINQVVGQ